ncbi:MAG: molybdopterin-guanine dinucleotide biosynthesis protein B [Burkholderiales bacterium]
MKVFGIAGYSGSGKTTLMERLIPQFVMEGLKVSVIKHAHHNFDVDKPGKDSYRHREAGASEILVTSDKRWVMMHESRGEAEPTLERLLSRFSDCDLVLVEGFKTEPIPKLEVHRVANAKPPLYPQDKTVIAIASDEPIATRLPHFNIDDAEAIAQFIMQYLSLLPVPAKQAGAKRD